ncbi:MAG: ABC transporter permease subunit [Candidatus Micrarchaeaceae archaeon]
MDFKNSAAIAAKDMKEVFTSVSIAGPMLGVPLFFALFLPVLTFYVSEHAAPAIASKIFSIALPVAISSSKALNSASFMGFFSVYVLGPIFLTMPILTASVIAADSFVGEKERKTAEALFSTPVKNSELLLGKILASFIPTLLLTLGVFALYGIITDALSFSSFGVYLLPTASWLMLLLISPFLAIVTIGIVVIVSSHVRGTKEAQQISTLLVLPILILPFAAITGFAMLTVKLLAYIAVFLAVADVLVIYISIKTFDKESII